MGTLTPLPYPTSKIFTPMAHSPQQPPSNCRRLLGCFFSASHERLPHIREDGFHFGLTPHLASLLMDDRTSGEDRHPLSLQSICAGRFVSLKPSLSCFRDLIGFNKVLVGFREVEDSFD
jgi:hypothetical protein